MKFSFLLARRVRIFQYVLFGAFIYTFFSVLCVEQLMALFYKAFPCFTLTYLLGNPSFFGVMGTLLLFPLLVGADRKWGYLFRRHGLLYSFLSIAIIFFVSGCLLSGKELPTLQLRTARYIALGRNREALDVGKEYTGSSPELLMLRLRALNSDVQIGNTLFDYPVHYYPAGQRQDACAKLNQRLSDGGLSYLRDGKSLFFIPPHVNALLDGNLDHFVGLLPKHYLQTSHCEIIPTAYRQALVLYMRLTATPLILYRDEATEADYRDFLAQRIDIQRQFPSRFLQSIVAERHLMHETFGNTYWYYYFYECPDPKLDL